VAESAIRTGRVRGVLVGDGVAAGEMVREGEGNRVALIDRLGEPDVVGLAVTVGVTDAGAHVQHRSAYA